jgi:DNA-binding NarL/FixJ family response regulator
MAKTIRLVLADDHRLVRDGIRSLLADAPDITILADVASGDALVEAMSQYATLGTLPDVVLLDVSMPVAESRIQSGLEAAAILTKTYPSVQILFLSMHEEAEYIINAMKTGARGYVLKNVEKGELLEAIRTVAEGNRYFSKEITERVMDSFAPPQQLTNKPDDAPQYAPTLTQREHEILQLVAEGLSTKIIAERLIISPRTVETHRTNIMHKLQAANTAELVRIALQFGLVKMTS